MANSAKSSTPPPTLPLGPGRGPMFGIPLVKAKDRRTTLLRIWVYLKHQKNSLAAVFFFVLLTTAANLASPYLLGQAIDQAITSANIPLLLRYTVLFIVIYLLSGLFTGLQGLFMARVAQYTVRELRNDLFNHLQSLPLAYFDKNSHGDIMSRLSNDVDNINNVLSEGATQFISSVLTLVGVVIVMLSLNIPMALVSLITVPLMMAITNAISKRTRKGFHDQQEALGKLNGIIEESVSGQRVIKAYVREQNVIADFEVENRKLKTAAIRAQTYSGLMGPLMNLTNNVTFAIVAAAGGFMALSGVATVGTIASFLSYARQFGQPLNQIANLYNSIQAALAGAERVFELLDETQEFADIPSAISLEKMAGEVVFDNVSFGYADNQIVLDHVTLHAHPGQTIAFVGPTGAGKTTIINLLSRFYDVRSGAILIDGHDIRTAQKETLRRRLGVVLQDTYLFSLPVVENIRYGKLDASDEEVVEAARLANADPFIRHLPQGYQTQLTERGANLSQGQRQLLAIARAILANPGILILDEATSSVDTRTEVHIQEALLRLMKGRTSFVIAHRLSTIREADLILVIHHGKVIEQGTHNELLAQNGFYQHLYDSQFRGQNN